MLAPNIRAPFLLPLILSGSLNLSAKRFMLLQPFVETRTFCKPSAGLWRSGTWTGDLLLFGWTGCI
jgi:hypothetical protein